MLKCKNDDFGFPRPIVFYVHVALLDTTFCAAALMLHASTSD